MKYIMALLIWVGLAAADSTLLNINEKEYFDSQAFDVIVFTNHYPEGHQGGVEFIHHGRRTATNGNIALQPTPGQWQPQPQMNERKVDTENNSITVSLQYPDSSRANARKNPMIYPDLQLEYKIHVTGEGNGVRIKVDLQSPLPPEWDRRIGFNLELFPGDLFGKTWYLDGQSGTFPHYANRPVEKDTEGEFEPTAFAEGGELVIAPENDLQRMKIKSLNGPLQLLDGRIKHNNGWFVVRSAIPAGAAQGAVEWIITPGIVADWHYGPVVHTSQVGYHPAQQKRAVIELDRKLNTDQTAVVQRIDPDSGYTPVLTLDPELFDREFLRYNYLIADFSTVKEPGMYVVQYGEAVSDAFRIDPAVYDQGVWQPVLEYFLPVQMCHMKVFEKYRVWHDVCHLDDALMAPPNIHHFDGYNHGELPEGFNAYQPIEGLDAGGWHDAGDYDMRIESQVGTVFILALAYEEFGLDYDQTLVDFDNRIVEIHHPDGKPDALQQIEHGLAAILGGYRAFGRLYRGIICNSLRQYVMLGDAGSMTDNKVFDGTAPEVYDGMWHLKVSNNYSKYYNPQDHYDMIKEHVPNLDDRMVFMTDQASRQLDGISGLAAASRVLRGYNDGLAEESLDAAIDLWNQFKDSEGRWIRYAKISALVELIITTGEEEYINEFIDLKPEIERSLRFRAGHIVRALPYIKNKSFVNDIEDALNKVSSDINAQTEENPFGVPYRPQIWGAGWGIQGFGFSHYFLHKHYPDFFTPEPMLNALNFVLGCHPGENTSSFASNVGTRSQIIAYGVNRGDWSYIPGGVVSGTNLTRPDFPEMKQWPYLWQQTEYVVGGGGTNFMFLVLGAQKLLAE